MSSILLIFSMVSILFVIKKVVNYFWSVLRLNVQTDSDLYGQCYGSVRPLKKPKQKFSEYNCYKIISEHIIRRETMAPRESKCGTRGHKFLKRIAQKRTGVISLPDRHTLGHYIENTKSERIVQPRESRTNNRNLIWFSPWTQIDCVCERDELRKSRGRLLNLWTWSRQTTLNFSEKLFNSKKRQDTLC